MKDGRFDFPNQLTDSMLQSGLSLPRTTVARASFYAYVAPSAPIASSFGVRSERGIVLIKIEDSSGCIGWGEIWSGMPATGAMHRLNLLREFVAPSIINLTFETVSTVVNQFRKLLLPVVRLAGEPGPVEQVLAGIDTALWDLQTRRLGIPLFRALGGTQPAMRCYASGLAPSTAGYQLETLRERGFRAFKFKAGFDDDKTIRELLRQRSCLNTDEVMMVDANCGWDLAQATAALEDLGQMGVEWIEEPLGPERPAAEWLQLKSKINLPIAAGENIFDHKDFDTAMPWIDVVQPDLAKWGGVTGVLETGRRFIRAGKRFCPHSFGTELSAIASAHVLAATKGDGFIELDVNPNPLRSDSTYAAWIDNGLFILPERPGLGFDVDIAALEPFLRGSHITP